MLKGRTEAELAAERLVATLDGFAWQQARRFHRRANGAGDLEDFRAAALLGLWVAALRYDPATGNEFRTYAAWWVRHYCGRHALHASWAVRERVAGVSGWRRFPLVALADVGADGFDREWEPEARPAAEPDLTGDESEAFWAAATAGLTRLEATVVRLYYRRGKSDEEVAATLSVTRARVNQLRLSALRRIKAGGRLAAFAGEGVACPA